MGTLHIGHLLIKMEKDGDNADIGNGGNGDEGDGTDDIRHRLMLSLQLSGKKNGSTGSPPRFT